MTPPTEPGTDRDLLRHTLATLAYRAEKALRDVPPDFASFRPAPDIRTPLEILEHLGDLMEWGERMAHGEYKWAPVAAGDWDAASDRFLSALRAFDEAVQASAFDPYSAGTIFQGPIADALTHVGQISLLRGMHGSPVRPESYARAEISTGRLGRDQSSTRKEFDGDASRRHK